MIERQRLVTRLQALVSDLTISIFLRVIYVFFIFDWSRFLFDSFTFIRNKERKKVNGFLTNHVNLSCEWGKAMFGVNDFGGGVVKML